MDHRAEHPFPDIAWYSGCIKCGLVVEPYHPERVLCQFGYIQTIPPRPFTPPRPDCSILLDQYWERWTDHVLTDQSRGRRCQYSGSGESVPEYMAWYDRISYRIVQPPQLRSGFTTDARSSLPSHAAFVTPAGSRPDPIGGSEPESGARDYLYYYIILYTVLGLSLTCSFSELYLYLLVHKQFQ